MELCALIQFHPQNILQLEQILEFKFLKQKSDLKTS